MKLHVKDGADFPEVKIAVGKAEPCLYRFPLC